VEIGQRLVVREAQHVLTPVVVDVAGCQAASHAWDLPGDTGAVRYVGQATPGAAQELGRPMAFESPPRR